MQPQHKIRDFAALDVLAVSAEISKLKGARLQKLYQKGSSFYLQFYKGKEHILFVTKNSAYFTDYKTEFPIEPGKFCMLLRKHLINSVLEGCEQPGFERILILKFSGHKKNSVVIELFSHGNFILIDENSRIIMPLHSEEWRARTIKKGEIYKLPPETANPGEISAKQLFEIIKNSDADLVRTLATKLGFGGLYAEEICFRASLDKNLKSAEASWDDVNKLHSTIGSIFEEAKKNPYPSLILKDKKMCNYSPIKLLSFGEFETKKFNTFSEACDEFFAHAEQEPEKERPEEKYKRILSAQMENLQKLQKEVPLLTEEAHTLSAKHNFREASKLYEKAKKLRKKIIGLESSIKETGEKIKKIPQASSPRHLTKKTEIRGEWYEKFRWFISSDNFLVVGGKDATTNEIIIKKHTVPSDLVFHAEITGAPFCVVKTLGREVPETTLEETAEFAASYSKAWQLGLGAIDVYYVKPSQLSKSSAGEFVGKGAFMVYGKKTYFRNAECKIAIGFSKDSKVISGPENSVKGKTEVYAMIVPGNDVSKELAKEIKNTWLRKSTKEISEKIKEIKLEDIQRFIPSGKGKITKSKV